MPLYSYSARDPNGAKVTGRRSASSPEDLASQLQQEAMIPIDINLEANPKNAKTSNSFSRPGFLKPKVSREALYMFSRQMYTIVKAGVPLGTAMTKLAETTKDKLLKTTLLHIVNSLNQGRNLYYSMAEFPQVFSSFYVNLIRIGEATGKLDEIFLHLAEYLELETDTVKKVKTTMRYPILVFSAVIIAIMIINLFVVPVFAKLFASFHAELPLPTRILIATSNFLLAYWYVLLVTLLIFIFAFRYYISTPRGEQVWGQFKIKVPVAGPIVYKIMMLRFSRLYALTLRSGLSAVDGIELVGNSTGNAYVAKKIKSVASFIARGNTIASSIAKTELFSSLVLQMISLGEESGSIDTLLDNVADFYQREVDYEIVKLADTIEPIVLIIMAAMVLVLALGVFLPMWNLASVAMKHS